MDYAIDSTTILINNCTQQCDMIMAQSNKDEVAHVANEFKLF